MVGYILISSPQGDRKIDNVHNRYAAVIRQWVGCWPERHLSGEEWIVRGSEMCVLQREMVNW